MNVFLLWSGGLDSTALLYANLKLGHHVRTNAESIVNDGLLPE